MQIECWLNTGSDHTPRKGLEVAGRFGKNLNFARRIKEDDPSRFAYHRCCGPIMLRCMYSTFVLSPIDLVSTANAAQAFFLDKSLRSSHDVYPVLIHPMNPAWS
ncbi:MAG: hypothetical protein EBV64_13470 [Oxalobacteraceae bacterium]|nr:hypothetical protein [Oxalobacteraceae bacterium]